MRQITYKKAGVDIRGASKFKNKIKSLVRSSFSKNVLSDIGGFGSFFSFNKNEYKDPVLVSSSDGVGTKLKIAFLANKHDTVGIDAVAMNVNDILCTGAKPLFFVDYIASGKLKPEVLLDVIKGINSGCIQAGCSLIGGETAEMPGMYKKDEYDIAGFCVGAVERKAIIDGSKIKAGDVVIGLESNGVHSNGYSLVRKVFSQKELKRLAPELLKPTRIYVKPVLSLLAAYSLEPAVLTGISHITGGAFYDKIARILPGDIEIIIRKESWRVPKIFRFIQNKGNVEEKEMYHTFNMGIGMVLIVDAQFRDQIISKLKNYKLRSWVIGEAVKRKNKGGVSIA